MIKKKKNETFMVAKQSSRLESAHTELLFSVSGPFLDLSL